MRVGCPVTGRCGWMWCLAAMVMPLLVAGCGDGGPPMAPVTGIVTHQGKPLFEANVLFMPEQGGPPAVGQTDKEGRYSLATNAKPGAYVGTHKVAIQAVEGFRLDGAPVEENPEIETESEGGLRFGRRWLIPPKYGSHLSSGLTATVEAIETNTINFELTGDPPGRRPTPGAASK